MDNPCKKEIVEDIQRIAKLREKKELSLQDYLTHPECQFTKTQLYDGGATWQGYCKIAGISDKSKKSVFDEEYFERLKEAVRVEGRIPKTSECKKYGLSLTNIKRRYAGGWGEFIQKAIELKYIPNLPIPKLVKTQEINRPKIRESSESNIVDSHHKQALTREIPPIPKNTKRKNWHRTDLVGFPYVPQEEGGVLAIFSILCHTGKFNWSIVDLTAKGIDAVCYDHDKKIHIRVELKNKLSKADFNHSIEDIDYVVCWENKWPDFPKDKVIELSKFF